MAEVEALDLPPREAVRHFRRKGLHAGFHWLDTDAASHLRSFTVAKAMRLDVLEDIRKAVDRSIAEGITFEEFQEQLEPTLKKRGWWGRQRMVDPLTGEVQVVQLGSPRRLRTIFDTNLRMSYSKGRWERIARVAEARRWLRYVSVLDERTRPEHRAMHGTVLPWDDPFWQQWYPPNGWHCRCTVQQLSDDDLKEFGFEPSMEAPDGWNDTRSWMNKRTGRVHQVPRGIDPGFDHNVGTLNLEADDADRLIARIDQADPALRRRAVGRPWRTELFRRHLTGAADGDWPVAVTEGKVASRLGSTSRVVRLSGATAAKQAVRRAGQDFRPEHYAIVQRALDEGTWVQAGRSAAFINGYVEVDGAWWMMALKRTRDGKRVYLQTLHRVKERDVLAARRKGTVVRD